MMKYRINKKEISYRVKGKKLAGNERVLLHQAIDLTAGRPWGEQGFVVDRLFDEKVFAGFYLETERLLRSLWKESGLPLSDPFHLDQYHLQANNQKAHLAAVEKTKLISVSDFPIPIAHVENRIAEICGTPLVAKNPFDNQSVFHFRVVRPNSNDNNPLHRDVWLKDYADCINLYIPIAGSNELSSLTIIPRSHHWPENKIERTAAGALLDGVRYNVPAVSGIKVPYEVVRPNPQQNEVLVFSPYLIHGGAVNLHPDQTRVSIELRLWRRN
jgi:hypothetical protein